MSVTIAQGELSDARHSAELHKTVIAATARRALHRYDLNNSAQFPRSNPGRGTRLINMCSNPPSTMIS
jgi:hypothetical protein